MLASLSSFVRSDEAIQSVARQVLSHKALSYYASASDGEIGAFVDC
jgi:hypothetical protein